MNGVTLGSIEDEGEDMDIILKSSQFSSEVSLEDVLAIPISSGPNTYVIGDFVDSQITNATASITRQDGDIQITVDGDMEQGMDSISTQATFVQFAEKYEYPQGITYAVG